jgi:hypothetical protein
VTAAFSSGLLLYALLAIPVGLGLDRLGCRVILVTGAILMTVGFALVIVAMPFELSGQALLAGWSALAVLALASRHVEAVTPGAITLPVMRGPDLAMLIRNAPEITAAAAGLLAVEHLVSLELPLDGFADRVRPAWPFTDREALAAGILVVAAALAAWATPRWEARRAAILVGFGAIAYAAPFELRWAATVVVWSALAVAIVALPVWDPAGRLAYLTGSAALMACGTFVTFTVVAPPSRLAVSAHTTVDHPLFWSGATAAPLALAVALAIIARRFREAPWARPAAAVAGA